jgi:hypothetical protein
MTENETDGGILPSNGVEPTFITHDYRFYHFPFSVESSLITQLSKEESVNPIQVKH